MIFLTYANTAHTDGLAAQLYRIYGIYCLARAFGFEYLHTPLARIDFQGLTMLRSQSPDTTLTDRANAIFTLPGSSAPDPCTYLDLPDPEPGFEDVVRQHAR